VTGGSFSEVDLDRLADYVGGALEGTPEAAAVARLVSDDPTWRQAHEQLVDAFAAVDADLRAFDDTPDPMPNDVADRLTAALAGAAPADAGRPRLVTVAGGRSATSTSRDVRRRRLLRWGAPIAVAAGVLAFAGFGLNSLLSPGNLFSTGTSDERAASSPGGAEVMDAPADSGAPAAGMPHRYGSAPADRILRTGTDYRRESLAAMQRAVAKEALGPQAAEDARALTSAGVDAALRRLVDRDALQACLDAIARAQAAAEIDVRQVDYARFEGAPAVVVLFVADGRQWAWVSGPGCGTPAFGADIRYRVPVG